MASIPILAAVAAAIIVPVAGTGIYYSVRSSKQKEGEVSAEIEKRLQDLAAKVRERTMNEPRTGLLQSGRIEQRGESAEQFDARTEKEKNEAKESLEKLLRERDTVDLNSVFPSTFNNTRTGSWASSHSSTPIRKP